MNCPINCMCKVKLTAFVGTVWEFRLHSTDYCPLVIGYYLCWFPMMAGILVDFVLYNLKNFLVMPCCFSIRKRPYQKNFPIDLYPITFGPSGRSQNCNPCFLSCFSRKSFVVIVFFHLLGMTKCLGLLDIFSNFSDRVR